MAGPKWTPELWARTQPHTFYSRWPTALRTKCDYCGVYYEFHPEPVAEEIDVAKHPMKAIPYDLDKPLAPVTQVSVDGVVVAVTRRVDIGGPNDE